jgi:hypothetical protein
MTSFTKLDTGKSRLDLLPPLAVDLMGQVLAHGAAKYAPNNWRRVDKRGRYTAATLRHLFAWMRVAERERLELDLLEVQRAAWARIVGSERL